MLRDKLEYQVSQQFLSCNKLILSRDICFMLHQRLHYTITVKHFDTTKDSFSVCLLGDLSEKKIQESVVAKVFLC